ncbi:MAG: PP2C family protein-serine/threonine phosphatase [Terriglobales bacterium]|jgi:serine phosphatase RsbU (regulator of sigma subunit)
MKIPFRSQAPVRELRKPTPAKFPDLPTLRVGALYRGARVGGDFFDFIQVGSSRLLVLLLDIAGKREEALHIAAAIQDVFHGAADLFYADDVNEPVALISMLLDINRAIMEAAGGVRCAPAFLGCYNEVLGTCCYVNAGHTPALLKQDGEITVFEANGLPLGLFSHATHDAQMCVMGPGSALVLVSRGLVEAKAHKEEFGLERVKQAVQEAPGHDAQVLCHCVLERVREFLESQHKHHLLSRSNHQIADSDPLGENDATALALVRCAATVAMAP